MKVFSLSDPKERLTSILFSVVISLCMIFLVFVLRHDLTLMLMTLFGAVLLILFLSLYVINVAKAACIPSQDKKTLLVKGMKDYTLDLSTAVQLETIAIKQGHSMSRTLVFSDDQENIVATLPTMFLSRSGLQAEPFAKELAQYLGLAFKANVPLWEYDEEARKEHEKQVALEEKENRKKRMAARREHLIRKYRGKK